MNMEEKLYELTGRMEQCLNQVTSAIRRHGFEDKKQTEVLLAAYRSKMKTLITEQKRILDANRIMKNKQKEQDDLNQNNTNKTVENVAQNQQNILKPAGWEIIVLQKLEHKLQERINTYQCEGKRVDRLQFDLNKIQTAIRTHREKLHTTAPSKTSPSPPMLQQGSGRKHVPDVTMTPSTPPNTTVRVPSVTKQRTTPKFHTSTPVSSSSSSQRPQTYATPVVPARSMISTSREWTPPKEKVSKAQIQETEKSFEDMVSKIAKTPLKEFKESIESDSKLVNIISSSKSSNMPSRVLF